RFQSSKNASSCLLVMSAPPRGASTRGSAASIPDTTGSAAAHHAIHGVALPTAPIHPRTAEPGRDTWGVIPVGRRNAERGRGLSRKPTARGGTMSTITTKDGTQIYYKDWGKGPVVTFSHGWPLNADAWDGQMLFLAQKGFRVIADDRRGHGRSSQPS